MRIWSAVRARMDRMLDPVCQDWGICMYGKYRGITVRLVPVADERDPNRIASWVPDQDAVEYIERARQPQTRASAQQPALPVVTPNAAPTDAGGGGFNPASASGL